MGRSRRALTGEHIGSKVLARDLLVSRPLEGGPPDSVEQRPTGQPIRDCLLGDCVDLGARRRVLGEVLPQLPGQRSLAADNVDCPLQGDNVVLLHGTAKYTRNLVSVNKIVRLTEHKESCKLLSMSTAKRKPLSPAQKQPKRKRAPEPEVGPDGRTLAQRVILLMTERGVGQTELARMCSSYYAAFVPGAEDKVKQQHIFNLLQGQSSAWAIPLLAAVFDVNDMWLQFGIGKKERSLKN